MPGKMEDHLLNTAKEKLSELVKKNGTAEDASHLYVRSGNVRDQVIALADELESGCGDCRFRAIRVSRLICWARKRPISCAMPMYQCSLCLMMAGCRPDFRFRNRGKEYEYR